MTVLEFKFSFYWQLLSSLHWLLWTNILSNFAVILFERLGNLEHYDVLYPSLLNPPVILYIRGKLEGISTVPQWSQLLTSASLALCTVRLVIQYKEFMWNEPTTISVLFIWDSVLTVQCLFTLYSLFLCLYKCMLYMHWMQSLIGCGFLEYLCGWSDVGHCLENGKTFSFQIAFCLISEDSQL